MQLVQLDPVCVSVCFCVYVWSPSIQYCVYWELAGLVDIAQQLGDFDEARHGALRLLLQPLVILPEALHLGLQHRLVLLLLPGSGTQHYPAVRAWQQAWGG